MLTKGIIMTVTGGLGFIITLVTFMIINKNTKKQLSLLMEGNISNGQYESKLDAKIDSYVVKREINIFDEGDTDVEDEKITTIEDESTTIESELTAIEDQSTIIDKCYVLEDESTSVIEDESTALL